MENDGEGQDGQEQKDLEQAIALVKAAPGQNVLDDSAFARIREKAAEAAAAPHLAEIERLKLEVTEGEAARARVKALDDEGKTTEQLYQEKLKEAAAASRQARLETEQARAEKAEAHEELQLYRLRLELDKLLPNAAKAARARREAMAEMPGIGLSTEGQLTFTDKAGELHVGEAAEAVVSEWWAENKDLHASAPAGPSTRGGTTPSPPPPVPDGPVYPPGSTFKEQLRIADRYDREQAAPIRGSGGG